MKFYENLQAALAPSVEEIAAIESLKSAVDLAPAISFQDIKDNFKDIIELKYKNERLIDALNIVLAEMVARDV